MLKSLSARENPVLLWIAARESIFNMLGAVVFIRGYALAVITDLWFEENGNLIAVLVIMGLLVGLFNVTHSEMVPYLVAATALVVIGGTQVFTPLNLVVDGLGEDVNLIVRMMAIFTAPAALIQALRAGTLPISGGTSSSRASIRPEKRSTARTTTRLTSPGTSSPSSAPARPV